MKRVLIDTNIWSAFLRRNNSKEDILRKNFFELVDSSCVVLIGPIRQEILSGIRDEEKFEKLRNYLSGFNDEEIKTADYEDAARIKNKCATKGIASTAIDLVVVAFAKNRNYSIYTRDKDFWHYRTVWSLEIYQEKE